MTIVEDRLRFEFDCEALKLDDSKFYRNKFEKIQDSIKSVDILAVDGSKNYFIEIKDYTHPETISLKQKDFISSIKKKVIDSFAILFPMKISSYTTEADIASKVLSNDNLTLILHVEKPIHRSKLEQSSWSESNIILEIKRQLKGIIGRPKFTSILNPNATLPWSVSRI